MYARARTHIHTHAHTRTHTHAHTHTLEKTRSCQWVRSITPNSGHSGISITERAVRLHNSGIGMARIQFCRFRPRGRILRSPARISRRMWHVGTRAKKLMFELAHFLHTRTKTKITSVRVQERGARRSVDRFFKFFRNSM